MAEEFSAPDANSRIDTTVGKALALFEILSEADTPLGISAISRLMNLQKSNVHRLLNTLIYLGYAKQDADTKRYFPSLKVWEIGLKVVKRDFLRVVGHRFLVDLSKSNSDPAFLSILSGTDILYIDTVDSSMFPKVAPTGSRTPAVFPASGKAILAFQDDPESHLDRILAALPQTRRVDRSALLLELEDVRRNGYASSFSGWREGLNAVAAPIFRSAGPPVAAIGLGGSAERMTKRRMRQVAGSVIEAASGIAELVPLYNPGY